MDKIEDNCGCCLAHSLHDAYNSTKSLGHRGRDSAGICAINRSGRIDLVTWAGAVTRFDLGNLHEVLPGDYHTFLGHVRYATKGKKEFALQDAHPIAIGGRREVRGDHVITRDCEMVAVHNGQVDNFYLKDIKGNFRTGTDTEKLLYYYKQHGERGLLNDIPGAYTMAIADKRRKDVVVFRDRTGIRPGILGEKDGKKVFASESIALTGNGATIDEDLDPGSIYYFSHEGRVQKELIVSSKHRFCFFEYNYLAHVSSILNDVSVNSVRIRLGEKLAEEFHPKVDFVTYLPRCPKPAAIAYANKIGVEFLPIFYKPCSDRAFMDSTPDKRKSSIEKNLYLVPEIEEKIRGKSIVCIDDSVVRGNNSIRVRELLYNVGRVKEAYLASYTPKIGIIGKDKVKRGCLFGVDMPPNDNFIARGRSNKEINEQIGMPVKFLSLEGMLKVYESLGVSRKSLCTFCIGGEHPLDSL